MLAGKHAFPVSVKKGWGVPVSGSHTFVKSVYPIHPESLLIACNRTLFSMAVHGCS